MAKGTGLAIFALILAIGGIGIGAFSYITLMGVQQAPGINRTYYDERIAAYTTPAEDSWYTIPGISITFQVESGESVYFMFTCKAFLDPVSAIMRMHFVLKIDGIRLYKTQMTVGPTTASVSECFFSVALQHVNNTLGAGSHTVDVETMREVSSSSYVDNSVLLVQTFT